MQSAHDQAIPLFACISNFQKKVLYKQFPKRCPFQAFPYENCLCSSMALQGGNTFGSVHLSFTFCTPRKHDRARWLYIFLYYRMHVIILNLLNTGHLPCFQLFNCEPCCHYRNLLLPQMSKIPMFYRSLTKISIFHYLRY